MFKIEEFLLLIIVLSFPVIVISFLIYHYCEYRKELAHDRSVGPYVKKVIMSCETWVQLQVAQRWAERVMYYPKKSRYDTWVEWRRKQNEKE